MNLLAKLLSDYSDPNKTQMNPGKKRSQAISSAITSVVEALETRQLLSSVVVNSLLDNVSDSIATGPSVTLREAVNYENSNGGGAISFSSSLSGEISLAYGELPISSSITITGPGAGALSINGGGESRIFDIDANDNAASPVVISGLTLTDGQTDSTTGGQSPGWGGAIYNTEQLTLSGDVISGSFASVAGGGVASTGPLTISSSQVTGDGVYSSAALNASAEGGGIYSAAALNVTSSSIENNAASSIATGYNTSTSVASSIAAGGGIYSTDGPAVITDSTLAGNVAISTDTVVLLASGSYGAGVYADGSLSVVGSTVTDNVVTMTGANGVGADGGGIFSGNLVIGAPATYSLTILQSTIAINAANGNTDGPGSGGGVYAMGGISIGNSIIAQNGADAQPDIAGVQSVQSRGSNLIGQSANISGWVASDRVGTALAPVDPMLGSLGSNGGPTQTMALLPGSPALAAGSVGLAVDQNGLTLSTDQRGLPRVVNGMIDIGAFETQVYIVPASTGSAGATTTVSSAANVAEFGTPVTFTATIAASAGTPTGSVQFLVNGVQAGAPVAISDGSASTIVSLLPTNVYSVTAVYSGDGAFISGTSAAYSQTVTYDASAPAPVGTFSSTGFDDFTAQYANPGHSVDVVESIREMPCTTGYYVSGFGAIVAASAPSGYFTSTTGEVLPTPAQAGSVVTLNGIQGSASAQAAGHGEYVPRIASSVASLASPGFYDPGLGNVSEIPDPAGTFSGEEATLPTVQLTQGESLENSELAGITDGYAGTFTFNGGTGTVLPVSASEYSQAVTYTPTDPTHYSTVQTMIYVQVTAPASVSSLSAATAPIAGGIPIAITGTGFQVGSGGTVAVDGLLLSHASILSATSTQVIFIMPDLNTLASVLSASNPLAVSVAIANPSGVLSNSVTIDYAPPVLNSISLDNSTGIASVQGGDLVTVTGTGFSTAAGGSLLLNVNGTPVTALDVTVVSYNELTFITPSFIPELQGAAPLVAQVSFAYGSGASQTVSNTGIFTVSPGGSLVVSSTDDNDNPLGYMSGDNSLRDAINYANVLSSDSTITFSSALLSGGPAVISLSSGELQLLGTGGEITIDGPGANLLAVDAHGASRVMYVGSGTTAEIDGLTIENGVADSLHNAYGTGGGILNDGTLTVNECLVTGNSANAGGGGGIDDEYGSLLLENSTLANNAASDGGGLLVSSYTSANPGGAAVVINTTIAGNTADSGGGIEFGYGSLLVQDSTITGNTSDPDVRMYGGGKGSGTSETLSGGAGIDSIAAFEIDESIVSGNLGTDDIGTGGTALSAPLYMGSDDLIGGDALLGTLGDYGGSTPTIPLLPGSPAFEAGEPIAGITTDQRGVARSTTSPSIGAFESQGFTLTVVGGGNQAAFEGQAFPQPFTVSVTSNDGASVAGGDIKVSDPGDGYGSGLFHLVSIQSDGTVSASFTAPDSAGTSAVVTFVTQGDSTTIDGVSVGISYDSASFVYDGQSQAPAPTLTDEGLAFATSFTTADGTPLSAEPVDVGSYVETVTLNGGSSDSTAFTIAQASLTATADSVNSVYGSPPQLTGTLDGAVAADGISVSYTTSASQFSNVGSYSITPVLNDPNNELSNYNITLTPGTLTISGAMPSSLNVVVQGGKVMVGAPVTIDAVVTGVAGAPLPPDGTVQFQINDVNVGGQVPVIAGTASLVYTFESAGDPTVTANYIPAATSNYLAISTLTQISVGQTATAAVSVSVTSGTYTGSPFTATATVTGDSGIPSSSLEGVTPTIAYYAGTSATGTALSGAPVTAGTYTVVASFAGSADYNPSTSSPMQFTIETFEKPLAHLAKSR